MAVHQAFADIEDGNNPGLFSKSTSPGARPRSRAHKHAKMIASACMDALMKLGETREQAARSVARKVQNWNCIADAEVDHTTIRNWREKMRAETGDLRKQYDLASADLVSHPDALKDFLEKGPPGLPAS